MVEQLENGAQPQIINPGELLRSERERVGFSTDEVARHLHLSRTTLGYLEEGRFDRLPGDTFTRGYIRSYARLLKLDPNTLAQYYDRYVGADQRQTRVNTINRVTVAPRRGARWVMALSTLVIVGSMLTLGLWWWSDSRDTGPSPDADDVSSLTEEVQVDAMAFPEDFNNPAAEQPAALEDQPLAPQGEAPAAESAPAEDQPGETEVTTAEPPVATEQAPVAAETPSAAESTTAETAGGTGLVMAFSANCWVQVSVPGGRVLHSAQMRQGQTLTIDQQGPLDLVIGAADAVSTIEFNGQPVELTANRQSGVARLRLGQ